MKQDKRLYHILALFTAAVWGTTFISTKILLNNGLSPAAIMLYRFLLAYVVLCLYIPPKFKTLRLRDEIPFIILGLCGGSLYFVTENTALMYTLTSNVSLIISITPILTAIGVRLTVKEEKLKNNFIVGSIIAMAGVAFVVYNGNFILKLNPIGDFLTLSAGILWSIYTITMKKLGERYDILMITRKVFFYGIVTLLPYFLVKPLNFSLEVLSQPVVFGNLLFLGIIASLLCYMIWNTAVKHLGSIQTNSYIYIVPLVTIITSSIILREPITAITIVGALFIFCGLYISERGFHIK